MTTNTFTHKEVLAGTSRTLLYGPVSAGVTSIVFAGTFANVDSTNKLEHKLTLELFNASSVYVSVLKDIPIPYGGSSECPKIVLLPNEALYVTTDTASMVQGRVDILERV
jgi:hypothetical protein